jgi:molybdopterin molybdotransferase
MLDTGEARRAILSAMPVFETESVECTDAAGRVLRQAVVAERDQPPFDRVTMDGIALRHAALGRGMRRFRIQEAQHAGDPAASLADDAHCIEIMTGAMLPQGADCIVPVERIRIEDGIAEIEAGYEAQRLQFVHARGSDYRRGSEILTAGCLLSPLDVAIIASCGLASVAVSRLPRIRVVSTGNELVPPGRDIEPHQVRLSNGPALVGMLRQQGFVDCSHEHLVDDRDQLRTSLADSLEASDVLVLSGGVSMGKADFVPQVLAELGVTVVFHKIRQRPGLPMWFGTGPGGQAVFALPGNPVSTLVCCRQYVLPALLHASGRGLPRQEWALLLEDVTFTPDLTCFLPVKLATDVDGVLRARPVPTNTSGDFTSLHGTDGYVELERAQSRFPQGSPVPLHRWSAP